MWQVVRISQGRECPLPNCPPFERLDHAEEFAYRLANSNPTRESPLLLAVRCVRSDQ
jgi:hypothetical protein